MEPKALVPLTIFPAPGRKALTGRTERATCICSGELDYFYPGLKLNGLWKHSPSTGYWTWMGGNNTPGGPNDYGLKGVASSNTQPSPRYGAVGWTDNFNDLWLYGGGGENSSNNQYTNNLWKYSITTGLWVWMGGSSGRYKDVRYGTKLISDSVNQPPAKGYAAGWTHVSGEFWLFGGDNATMPGATGYGSLNDLWKFSPASGYRTWMGGANKLTRREYMARWECQLQPICPVPGPAPPTGPTQRVTSGSKIRTLCQV